MTNTDDPRTTTYRDTSLDPNTTRYYRVSAINFYGTGDPSDIKGAITPLAVPDAPAGLTAEPLGRSAIELDWTQPSPSGTAPVTGYRIEWSSTGRSGWGPLVADTRSRTTRHTDGDLLPGTRRYYRVAAISDAGTSDWSNVDDATTDDLTVPDAPTGLRATTPTLGLGGDTQIQLSWRPPSNDGGSPITGYRIERRSRTSDWRIHVPSTGNGDCTVCTYADRGLSPNTTWSYRVRALNAQGQGNPSNVADGTTRAAAPGPPQNLDARGTGPNSILLTWDAPGTDGGMPITGYAIQRKIEPDGTWIEIERNTGLTATTFTDTGLQPATSYGYQVAAINRVGRGDWSFKRSETTYADVPDAPTGLTAREGGHLSHRPVVDCAPQHRRRPHPRVSDRGLRRRGPHLADRPPQHQLEGNDVLRREPPARDHAALPRRCAQHRGDRAVL